MGIDGTNKKRKPFQKIQLKGTDLELGTLSRLDHFPSTSGVELFLRSGDDRTKGTKN